jgi:hypothetical protein
MPYRAITIVSVDGRLGDHLGAQYAIVKSAQALPGAKMLLLSPERPKTLLDGIEHLCIKPLGYFDYSLFMLYGLHLFIKTDFALIVQHDGWVLNGDNWDDRYWNYDYIGAPVHIAKVTENGDAQYIRQFRWVDDLDHPNKQIDIVLNGGFSLRSRRFLQALSHHKIPYQLPAPNAMKGPPYELHWRSDSQFEDVYLCINQRATLEGLGLKFAPLSIAKQFSFEHLHPKLHQDVDIKKVLGQHARFRHLTSIQPLSMTYNFPKKLLPVHYNEPKVCQLFKQLGYQINFSERA